jgi:hypothetical protein
VEDQERRKPDPEITQREEEDADVEAHKVKQEGDMGATEEGPDVEGHKLRPKAKP